MGALIASLFTRGRRWWIITAGGLVTVLAALVVVSLVNGGGRLDATAPRDMNGQPVRYELDAAPRPEASATPDGYGRFTAPGVGLDVPLGALDATAGEITPPGFQSAYLVRNVGVTPDRSGMGAVYVVMHSLRNGAVGPGNALIDIDQETARIVAGDELSVDGVTYSVTGAQRISKAALPSSDIWTAGAGSLVVITCLQRPYGGPSVDNIVITARRV